MKLPDITFPMQTHPTFWEFYETVQTILNTGRYELRVVTQEPTWVANDGEMVLFDDTQNNRKHLYMYISDGWYSVTFLATSGGGTRLHHVGEGILWFGSDTDIQVIPANTIVMNGAAISRTTYGDLFNIIGTTYGAGDGSTTYNIPDVRGRVLIGADNMGGSSANRITAAWADSLGGTGGDENLQSHTHTVPEGNTGGSKSVGASDYGSGAVTTSSAGTGAGGNIQPSIAAVWLIQA